MKKLLFILVLTATFALNASAQDCCGDGKQCLTNDAINKCASVATELKEARTVIVEFQKERGVSIAEREAAAKVIAGLNELLLVKDRVILATEQMNTLYKQVITFQAEIIDRLEKRLLQGKSGFQRFVTILKEIGILLAGISLGRGL